MLGPMLLFFGGIAVLALWVGAGFAVAWLRSVGRRGTDFWSECDRIFEDPKGWRGPALFIVLLAGGIGIFAAFNQGTGWFNFS